MRIALALIAAAGLAVSALAQDAKPDAKPETKPTEATQPAAQPGAVQPELPATPSPIPVPDLPVVKTTELEGGVIAEDMVIGEGYEVKEGGAIVAHYHGTLKADPTKVFDSTFKTGQPAIFPLPQLFKGWQIGVPGMKVGGIRRITIPAALGLGAEGSGDDMIPPNSDLVFVIKLLDALQVVEVKEGEGDAVAGQFVAVTAHTIKDKDGKTLESCDASKPHIWLPNEFAAVEWGLGGMKAGGKRKLIVPKELNIGSATGKPDWAQNVPLEIEVELVALRNLPMRQR